MTSPPKDGTFRQVFKQQSPFGRARGSWGSVFYQCINLDYKLFYKIRLVKIFFANSSRSGGIVRTPAATATPTSQKGP
jgi:hypothetical protein